MSRDLGDELLALERQLLRPEVRASPEALSDIITLDFVEHGASGRRYDRAALIAALSRETTASAGEIHDLAARLLAPDVALVTYCLVAPDVTSLRASMWVHRDGAWRLTFHQGTRV